MNLKKSLSAFTLAEILVVISIIAILSLGINSINFNRISKKQDLEVFTNKVTYSFENVRNDALLGKGIGTDLNVPEKWKIDFSNVGSGQIVTSYFSGSWFIYTGSTLVPQKNFNISEINCLRLDNTVDTLITNGIGTIEFIGSNLSLTGACTDTTSKKLEIVTDYGSGTFEKTIHINMINGLVEYK
ncbi:prepilin-type N-terminal cleavage/methylation domain-containing protein [Candidatus Gracilibacteria bacterium 28_42_T64]|nr:prepilin-type N-terminal cleavage/methylation domain-containing protein [Candidatus Gracilibacteria bacterium 28_42_T64]